MNEEQINSIDLEADLLEWSLPDLYWEMVYALHKRLDLPQKEIHEYCQQNGLCPSIESGPFSEWETGEDGLARDVKTPEGKLIEVEVMEDEK